MKISKNLYNLVSILGAILAINSLLLIFVLFVIAMFSNSGNTYLGLYIYIVLPTLLVIGLILIPIGMIIKFRKKEKTAALNQKWPILDLNNPKQRKGFEFVTITTIILLLISAMGSYQAFHYSESVDFCGKLCHSVMNPEYVTYQNSPHARVRCVECHVGEGADWYVKSKLSGLYQVYSVIFKKYSKPIGTPLHNLRPARETCEKCHWPEKFYARKLTSSKEFLTDSGSTEWNYTLLMKIGPSYSAMGLKEGIHWHINKDIKIEYKSSTSDRESIPWVKYTNIKTGEVQIFEDTAVKLSAKAKDSLEIRVMDCMDCHNRPSHTYKSPSNYINNALTTGSISKDLPFIKKIAMRVLKENFNSTDSAMLFIRDTVNQFYKTNYPEIFKSKKGIIDLAVAGIQAEFKRNSFPEMKANNSNYLNHIGHLESNGCFRCHSDRHRSQKGKVISKDCNWCHTIVAQGPATNLKSASIGETLEFKHPVDIGTDWKTNLCSECHKSLY